MSQKQAFLILGGAFLLFFSPVLFHAEVIFPHTNAGELGLVESPDPTHISNRRFSDESSVFIPELANNLSHDRKGWLATWNPHVQLGRPALSGALSRAFVLTNALSAISDNPFVLYTLLVLVTVGLTGLFMLLYLRALGLRPAACLCGAVGLAFTTPSAYWLTLIMFVSALCWPVCLLWLTAEFTAKPSWSVGFGLIFATYCLLISSYPQTTILSTYIVGSFAFIRLANASVPNLQKLRLLIAMVGCGLAGLVAASPGLIDMWQTAKQSARLSGVSDEFFLGVMPIANPAKVADFFATLYDWSWLGNSIDPRYPLTFNGMSFTPFYGTLIWLSFLLKRTLEIVVWQAILGLCLLATVVPDIYLFAVHHLGFQFSRIQMVYGGLIPGFVLSAATLDSILRGEVRFSLATAVWCLIPLIALSGIALAAWHQFILSPIAVVGTVAVVGISCYLIRTRADAGFALVSLLSSLLYGRSVILSQPTSAIRTSSPLTQAVSESLSGEQRFALADNVRGTLRANEEALLRLNSINCYDPLASSRYRKLTDPWSQTGASDYTRYFRLLNVSKALADPLFPLANVKVVLSARPLPMEHLTLKRELRGIKFYEPKFPPVASEQVTDFRIAGRGNIEISSTGVPLMARTVQSMNDFRRIELTRSPRATILFLSQQYHSGWKAKMAGDKMLQTVVVNSFYQGVLIPPNTEIVELNFRPRIMWSWVPQVIFALGFSLIVTRWTWRKLGSPLILRWPSLFRVK